MQHFAVSSVNNALSEISKKSARDSAVRPLAIQTIACYPMQHHALVLILETVHSLPQNTGSLDIAFDTHLGTNITTYLHHVVAEFLLSVCRVLPAELNPGLAKVTVRWRRHVRVREEHLKHGSEVNRSHGRQHKSTAKVSIAEVGGDQQKSQ